MASNAWKSISSIAYFGIGFGSGLVAGTACTAYIYADDLEKQKARRRNGIALMEGKGSTISKSFTTPETLKSKHENYEKRLAESIKKAEKLCELVKTKYGLPGLVAAVSVNGITHWTQGFGYADLENEVEMKTNAVIRIGSISKPMTMAMLGKFMEEKKIDLDLPVQHYVPNFPKKVVDGKEVVITTRHLLSHLSGIRHYLTKEESEKNPTPADSQLKEFYLKTNFESVDQALELFKNDELLHEPGSKFTYTTHGYTLVSAVLEKIAGSPFHKYATEMFKTWGLDNTYLDVNDPIINYRARPYTWNTKKQCLENSPYVNNSYKWAGGGFISNAHDIVRFGNILLSSFQNNYKNADSESKKINNNVFLKSQTVADMWKGDPRTVQPGHEDIAYGLGFVIFEPMKKCFFCKSRNMMSVTHGGGANGGTSVLLMTFPKHFRFECDETDGSKNEVDPVKGVCVAMLTNITGRGLTKTAEEITELFKWLI